MLTRFFSKVPYYRERTRSISRVFSQLSRGFPWIPLQFQVPREIPQKLRTISFSSIFIPSKKGNFVLSKRDFALKLSSFGRWSRKWYPVQNWRLPALVYISTLPGISLCPGVFCFPFWATRRQSESRRPDLGELVQGVFRSRRVRKRKIPGVFGNIRARRGLFDKHFRDPLAYFPRRPPP